MPISNTTSINIFCTQTMHQLNPQSSFLSLLLCALLISSIIPTNQTSSIQTKAEPSTTQPSLPLFTSHYILPLPANMRPVDSIFSSTGKYLANIYEVDTIRSVLEVRIAYTSQLIQSLSADKICGDATASITSVTFNRESSFMAIGLSNSQVYIYQLPSLTPTAYIFKPQSQSPSIQSLSFTNDNKYLILGLLKNKIIVWDYKNENNNGVAKTYETDFDNLFVLSVDAGIGSDGEYEFVAAGGSSGNGKVTLYRLVEGEGINIKVNIIGLSSYSIKTVIYSQSGTTLYFCDGFGTVYKYDIPNQNLQKISVLQPSTLYKLQLQSTQSLVSVSYPSKVALLDWSSGKVIQSYSSSYSTFAMSSYNGLLFLYDNKTSVFMGRCSSGQYYSDQTNDCTQCPANCRVCDRGACYVCLQGFFLKDSQCLSCIIGCLDCENDLQCNACDVNNHFVLTPQRSCVCQKSYFQKDLSCLACGKGCINCIDDTHCVQCSQTYDLIDGQCLCKQGSFDDGKQCKSCIKGCRKCVDGQTCQVCDQNEHYVLVDNRCECDADAHFVDDGHGCVCEDGYFYSAGKCIKCQIGCKTCISLHQCTSCIQDLILVDGDCKCSDKSKYLDPYTLTCKNCNQVLAFCIECESSVHCDKCDPDTNREPQPDSCQCKSGFFPDHDQICKPCDILGCIKCDSLDTCSICDGYNNWEEDPDTHKCRCMQNYTQYEDKCIRCEVGCKLCDPTQCFECDINGHWIADGKGQCQCDKGYFQNQNVCNKCMVGCLSCQKGEYCDSCDTASHFINKNGICICEQTYFLNQSTCLTCSLLSHCLICSSKEVCTTCQKSYIITPTGKCSCPSSHYVDPKDNLCKQCEPGCLECTAKNNCIICEKGYILKEGACVKKKSIWRGVEIIFGVMVLAAILFGLLKG